MALYGAIVTLHDTEQNRTHPSRNILRDRLLKVKMEVFFILILHTSHIFVQLILVLVLFPPPLQENDRKNP